MRKKINLLIALVITILFFINIKIVLNSTIEAVNLFFDKIFISIFPFLILSDILINYNFIYYFSKIFGNLFQKIFHIKKEASIVIILSLLTSHPTNAIYIKDLLDKKIINKKEAEYLLTISYFPNPAFVIGTIGFLFFNNIYIGIILLFIIYLTNFILGILLRDKYYKNDNSKLTFIDSKTLSETLKYSIIKSLKTLSIILGNIIMFLIISNIASKYFDFNDIFKSIIMSTLELTNAVNFISDFHIFNLKISITTFALVFSGLSIHFQVNSILSEYKLNIKKTIIIKFITSTIVSIILFTIVTLLSL